MKIKNQKSKIKNLFIGFLILLIPQIASAETSTTVDVKTETGGNTVCVNGECRTSTGMSKSKVCVNGECYESDGDLYVESKNGQVRVNKNSNGSGVATGERSREDTDNKAEAEESIKGASSVDTEAGDVGQNQIATAEADFSFVKFVKDQLSFLREIITFQFLFGDK